MESVCIKCNNHQILNSIKTQIESCTLDGIKAKEHKFKIYSNIIVHYKGENIAEFYDILDKILTKIIIAFYEPILLKRILNINYCYFEEPDKKVILDEYKIIKSKYPTKNEELIYAQFQNYFSQNCRQIVLIGFVNFCLYEYTNRLENLLTEAVNQYIVDKEYLVYVNLLKDYVEERNCQTNLVNLVYQHKTGFLFSESGKPIELDKIDSKYVSDISFSTNDYVLNTLVGLIPAKIKIHLLSPEDQFIKTIKLIFTDRVEICHGCSICNSMFSQSPPNFLAMKKLKAKDIKDKDAKNIKNVEK